MSFWSRKKKRFSLERLKELYGDYFEPDEEEAAAQEEGDHDERGPEHRPRAREPMRRPVKDGPHQSAGAQHHRSVTK